VLRKAFQKAKSKTRSENMATKEQLSARANKAWATRRKNKMKSERAKAKNRHEGAKKAWKTRKKKVDRHQSALKAWETIRAKKGIAELSKALDDPVVQEFASTPTIPIPQQIDRIEKLVQEIRVLIAQKRNPN